MSMLEYDEDTVASVHVTTCNPYMPYVAWSAASAPRRKAVESSWTRGGNRASMNFKVGSKRLFPSEFVV